MLSLLAETFSGDFAGADHWDFYIYVHECLFEKIKKKGEKSSSGEKKGRW